MIPVVLVLLISTLTISAINALEYRASYRNALEDRTEAIAQNVREAVYQNLRFFALPRLSGVPDYLTSVVSSSQVLEYAIIMDVDGALLYQSEPSPANLPPAPDLFDAMPDESRTRAVGVYYETTLPIVWQGELVGALRLGVQRQTIDRQITGMLLQNLAVVLVSLTVSSWLLVRLLERGVVRPVSKLANVVSRLEDGQGQVVAIVDREDEFGTLARAYNQMARRVRNLIAGQEQHIAELKHAQDALRRSQMRYRELFDGVPIGLYRTSRDGRILAANTALAEMLGYPDVQSLLKVSVQEFYLSSEDRLPWLEMGANTPVRSLDVQLRRRDGSIIWARDRARIVFDESEQIVCYDGSLEDITEQKQAEQDLCIRDSAMASAISGIGIADLQGNLMYANHSLANMLGYDAPDELLGLGLAQLLRDQTEQTRKELDERGWSMGETTVHRRDGSIFQAQMSLNVVAEEHGEEQHLFVSFVDITARKRLAEQLLQAQKMEVVGRLAGGIAHDFNNLLTIINGYSYFALQNVPEDSPLHEDLELIDQAGRRAADLTRRLLAFSRRQVTERSIVDLNEVLAGMGKMLSYIIGDDVRLELLQGASQAYVLADAAQIEQVVMNLASNARDAMPSGGSLTISTEIVSLAASRHAAFGDISPGEWVVLAVTDTGTGMPAEVQEHLFEPFFTTKEVGKGTGLGLAMIYGIVEEAEGYVDVSSAVEQGTTFSVFLPRIEAGDPELTAAIRPVLQHGDETIMVVEDRDEVRGWLDRALRSLGYATIPLASGAQALAALADSPSRVDLVLTDVAMPQMSGIQLAHTIRELRPNMPLIYVTGNGWALDDAVDGVPNAHVLSKPLSVAALAAQVYHALHKEG